MVTLVTLVATIWLYIVIPKGFLPPQDTGLITAVTEAGQDISFSEMQKLQAKVVDAIRQDNDVTGVVSIVGVTTLNATPNAGRLMIALRPRDGREAFVTAVVERLKTLVAPIPGVQVFFQPVQDIQISTRLSRAQYQYTLTGTDVNDVLTWADRLAERLQASPLLRDVASEAQDSGLRALIKVDREKAGRLGISMQIVNDTLNDAFGQRQISTIYGQANQYRVILEAAPEYQRDPVHIVEALRAGVRRDPAGAGVEHPDNHHRAGFTYARRANAAERDRQRRADNRAAGRHARRAVPGRHHQLQPHRRSFARRSGRGCAGGRTRNRHADLDYRQPMRATRRNSTARWPASRGCILAAAITIYIVLGVLYESFIHPLTILSTLPSAGVGALLALMLFGQDLSIVGADRHRAADGHREEERHHDDRLRARGGAR